MVTLTLQLPEPVAAEFFQAADVLNARFCDKNDPKVDGHALMAFALSRYDANDVCAHFDLALRLVQGPPDRPFNPVLK